MSGIVLCTFLYVEELNSIMTLYSWYYWPLNFTSRKIKAQNLNNLFAAMWLLIGKIHI